MSIRGKQCEVAIVNINIERQEDSTGRVRVLASTWNFDNAV